MKRQLEGEGVDHRNKSGRFECSSSNGGAFQVAAAARPLRSVPCSSIPKYGPLLECYLQQVNAKLEECARENRHGSTESVLGTPRRQGRDPSFLTPAAVAAPDALAAVAQISPSLLEPQKPLLCPKLRVSYCSQKSSDMAAVAQCYRCAWFAMYCHHILLSIPLFMYFFLFFNPAKPSPRKSGRNRRHTPPGTWMGNYKLQALPYSRLF